MAVFIFMDIHEGITLINNDMLYRHPINTAMLVMINRAPIHASNNGQ